jgi:hypothetical protein
VAAAHVMKSGAFLGRRATVAAVQSTFAWLHRELTCLTDPVRAAVAGGMVLLTARLLLLMLLPGPGRVHLASLVVVPVAVVRRLRLLVVGADASIDAPPEAWHWFAER